MAEATQLAAVEPVVLTQAALTVAGTLTEMPTAAMDEAGTCAEGVEHRACAVQPPVDMPAVGRPEHVLGDQLQPPARTRGGCDEAALTTTRPRSAEYALRLAEQMLAAPSVVEQQKQMRKNAKAASENKAKAKAEKDKEQLEQKKSKLQAKAEATAAKATARAAAATAKAAAKAKPKAKPKPTTQAMAAEAKAKCQTDGTIPSPAAAKLPLKGTPKACAKATSKKRSKPKQDVGDGPEQPAKRCQVAAEGPPTDPYKAEDALLPPGARVPYEQRQGRHSYTLRRAGFEGRITVLCGSQSCLPLLLPPVHVHRHVN